MGNDKVARSSGLPACEAQEVTQKQSPTDSCSAIASCNQLSFNQRPPPPVPRKSVKRSATETLREPEVTESFRVACGSAILANTIARVKQ